MIKQIRYPINQRIQRGTSNRFRGGATGAAVMVNRFVNTKQKKQKPKKEKKLSKGDENNEETETDEKKETSTESNENG